MTANHKFLSTCHKAISKPVTLFPQCNAGCINVSQDWTYQNHPYLFSLTEALIRKGKNQRDDSSSVL